MNHLPKNFFRVLILTASIWLTQTLPTFAYGWAWTIPDFKTDIHINADSSITVTEKIQADFTQEEHHGIFRMIPVSYEDLNGIRSSIRLKVLSVTDEKGKAWPYTQSTEGDFIQLTIGDPDVYLHSIATYNIQYQVEKAIGYFKDHDELYWNATGDKWPVPINQAEVTVTLPQTQNTKDLRATCYTGNYGATTHNCTAKIQDGSTLTYATTGTSPKNSPQPMLRAYEGLTIVAGFPKNMIPQPSLKQEILWFLMDNWGFTLPFITFGGLFFMWYKKGRDPQGTQTTIMPIYSPPDNLTPSEVGTMIDEKVDMRDITSAMIDLAIRGYLRINETKDKGLLFSSTNYEFEKLKEYSNDTTLKDHEKKLLRGIFKSNDKIKLSDLQYKFYKDLPKIKESIYDELVTKGYFPTSPENVRKIYQGIGMFLIFGAIFGLGFLIQFSLSIPIGIGLSGALFFIFGARMPAKTTKGVDVKYKILGLQEYIVTAETDRIKFQEKETKTISKENLFEKLLPYAMALGVAEKWTKAFEGIYKNPPSWYHSSDPNFASHFSTYYFLNSLNHVSNSMNQSFTSAPRSSGSGFGGGGFSGGGGGGGGGGAW